MKQIENFYMGSLRNNEDYGFHTLVIKAINNLPAVDEGTTDPLKATRENYIAQFTTFDRAYQQTKKLDEVETLEAADAEADEAYSASRIFINVMRRHPDEAKRTFAEEVGRIYDKYEIPVKLGYTEELAVLRNLLQELESYLEDFMRSIHFDEWVTYLSEKTDALEAALKKRAEAEGRKSKGIIKTTREAADEAYRQFAARVNVVADYEGNGKYDEFIDYVNALIKQQKANLKARATKSSNKKDGDLTFKPVDPTETEPKE